MPETVLEKALKLLEKNQSAIEKNQSAIEKNQEHIDKVLELIQTQKNPSEDSGSISNSSKYRLRLSDCSVPDKSKIRVKNYEDDEGIYYKIYDKIKYKKKWYTRNEFATLIKEINTTDAWLCLEILINDEWIIIDNFRTPCKNGKGRFKPK